jgi:hypothetical protein
VHPAEDQHSFGVITVTVHVETLSDADHPRSNSFVSCAPRPLQVGAIGDLAVAEVTRNGDNPTADRFHQRGIVGALAALGVGLAEHVGAERLRRLDGDERRAVRRRDTAPSVSTILIVSLTGTAGTAPSAPALTASITRR